MISYLNKSGIKIKERLFETIVNREGTLSRLRSELNSGINFEAYEEDLFYNLDKINSLKQCNVEDFESLRRYIEYKTNKIMLLKEIVGEDFVFYKEYIVTEKNKIEGKLNEVKSKIAFLGGFQGNVVSSLVEDFNNYGLVNQTEENTLQIDTRAHVLTLPIQSENSVGIKDIKILSSSNGVPGNILEETNSYISNSVNAAENLYFEYYKKGSKALNLNLEIYLNKQEVINNIIVKIKQKYLECNFVIKNINFISENDESISIYSLIDSSEQELLIQSYNVDNELSIRFLPVKASRIKIYLECNKETIINDLTYNALAIKQIEVKKIRYSSEGKISFKEYELEKSDGSILNAKIKCYPKNKNLLNYNHVVSFENEAEIILEDEKLIIDANYDSVKYKFHLSKPENLNSIYSDNEEDLEINLKVKQNLFNRDVIPNTFIIDSESEYLDIYQPEIYSRSYLLRKAKRVGFSKSEITRFLLPEKLSSLNMEVTNLEVYLDNELCKFKNTTNLTSDLEYFSDGEWLWVFDSSEKKDKEVKVIFNPIECESLIKNEKVFFEIKEFFDRDLENINIVSFSTETLFATEDIIINESFTGFVKFRNSYIKKINIKGSLIGSESTFTDVSNSFEINKKLGTAKQIQDIENLYALKIEYEFFQYQESKPEKLWIRNNKIYGCSIKSNEININQYTQYRGEALSLNNSYRNVTFEEKTIRLQASNELFLKSRNILQGSLFVSADFFNEEQKPKEVPFINGKDEFLNLENIDKETVPLMESNSLGEIKFTLRRSPSENLVRVYKDNNLLEDISFSLEGRVITLAIPEASSKGYSVSYFTENKAEKNELFIEYSVNYLEGILYCEEEMKNTNNGETIHFQSTNSVLEFDVCKEIKSYEKREEQVSINFSNSSKVNQKVKMSWKKKELRDFSDLTDYYSPIIYQIQYQIRG